LVAEAITNFHIHSASNSNEYYVGRNGNSGHFILQEDRFSSGVGQTVDQNDPNNHRTNYYDGHCAIAFHSGPLRAVVLSIINCDGVAMAGSDNIGDGRLLSDISQFVQIQQAERCKEGNNKLVGGIVAGGCGIHLLQ